MTESAQDDDLIHCIYSSVSKHEFTNEDIISLLNKARETNSGLGVTGMLLYQSGSFFQILEGPAKSVHFLYKKIGNDKRHEKVVKLIEEPISKRSFAEWTMGYSNVSKDELRKIEGLNDFFSSGKVYTQLDKSRAKKLLEAFKEGRWRSSLNGI